MFSISRSRPIKFWRTPSSANHIISTSKSHPVRFWGVQSWANQIWGVWISANHIWRTLSSANQIWRTRSSANHIIAIPRSHPIRFWEAPSSANIRWFPYSTRIQSVFCSLALVPSGFRRQEVPPITCFWYRALAQSGFLGWNYSQSDYLNVLLASNQVFSDGEFRQSEVFAI